MKPKLALAFLSSHRAEVALPHVSYALKKIVIFCSATHVSCEIGETNQSTFWKHELISHGINVWYVYIHLPEKNYIYIYIHLQIYGIFTYIIVNTYMQNTMDPRSLQKGQPPPKIGDERTSESAMKKKYTSDWAWLDDFNMVQLTKRFRYLYIGHPWNLT